MKLSFDNVGPFLSHNEIDIERITVLAGVNGSGKSTCGKLLFCIFNCFHNIDNKIVNERKRSINSYLSAFMYDGNNTKIKIKDIRNFTENLFDNSEQVDLYEKLYELFKDSFTNDQYEFAINKIKESLELDDSIIRNRLLSNQIEYEFGKQFCNIYNSDKLAHVDLFIKNKSISFVYDSDGASISNYFPLSKNIFYFDDPNLLDYLDTGIRFYSSYDKSHQNMLLIKLSRGRNENLSSVDHILLDNKLLGLENKLQQVCDGDIVVSENGVFQYYSKVFKNGLNISNMATGLKTFALLKLLMKNGYLEENGTVIFDEPEIHLHPEWQMAWAEIIVLLNKVFGIHVLLSSHSSDFLLFLEYFSKKYELNDGIKLYSLERNENGSSIITDASSNWDVVYEKLGLPFIQITEDLNSND